MSPDPATDPEPRPAPPERATDRCRIDDRGGFLVRRLHQIWSGSVQRAFRDAGHDITSVQFAALETIVACAGLDQTDLALRIGYDRATTGGLIQRLEKAGYVRRQPDPRDRRARRLVATDAGTKAATALARIAQETDSTILASLSATERDALLAALRKLVEGGEALDAAPPFRPTGKSAERPPSRTDANEDPGPAPAAGPLTRKA